MLLSIDETHTSTGSYGNDFEFSKKQFIFVVWETIFLTLFLVMYKWSQDYSRYMWKIHPMKQLLTPRKMLEGLFQKASIFIILINDMFSFCFFSYDPLLNLNCASLNLCIPNWRKLTWCWVKWKWLNFESKILDSDIIIKDEN